MKFIAKYGATNIYLPRIPLPNPANIWGAVATCWQTHDVTRSWNQNELGMTTIILISLALELCKRFQAPHPSNNSLHIIGNHFIIFYSNMIW